MPRPRLQPAATARREKVVITCPQLQFVFRTDESPYRWQEAYDEAAAAGRRLQTIAELRAYIESNPSVSTQFDGLDLWTPVVNPGVANTKDFVQNGNSPHARGRSVVEMQGIFPSWGSSSEFIGVSAKFENIQSLSLPVPRVSTSLIQVML